MIDGPIILTVKVLNKNHPWNRAKVVRKILNTTRAGISNYIKESRRFAEGPGDKVHAVMINSADVSYSIPIRVKLADKWVSKGVL